MVSGGMNSKIDTVFAEDPPAVVLGELEISTLRGDALRDAACLLEEEHYLGAGRPVGRTVVQAVHHHGRWVALLVWGPAALKLAGRDEAIGWTDSQRAERIGLVVQNRRFLVLAKIRMPNLASRALGLAVNALPAAWEQLHGFRPLLAETFTDIAQFEGTCYKAAGWQPCGHTKGFTREHRADYYVRNDRPKKLWLRTLNRNAGPMLRAIDMAPGYEAGINRQSPERALPLRNAQIDSLRKALREVSDPRARNRVFACSSLLGITPGSGSPARGMASADGSATRPIPSSAPALENGITMRVTNLLPCSTMASGFSGSMVAAVRWNKSDWSPMPAKTLAFRPPS